MELSLEFMVHLFQECYVTMPVMQGECSNSHVCRKEFFLPKQDFRLSSSPPSASLTAKRPHTVKLTGNEDIVQE